MPPLEEVARDQKVMATCQSQVRKEHANERITRLLIHQTEVEDELDEEYHLMDKPYDLELVPLHMTFFVKSYVSLLAEASLED